MQVNSYEEIEKIQKELKREIDDIERGIIEICFFMRGGISWSEAWNLTLNNFKNIRNQIKKNLETLNKSGIGTIGI